MQHQEVTKIDQSGLRYESKPNGSQFGTSIGQTMSCIKCGIHRPRALLMPMLLAGKRQYKCKEKCDTRITTASTDTKKD